MPTIALFASTIELGTPTIVLFGPAGAFEQKVTVLARIFISQYFHLKAIARKTTVFFVPSFVTL